MKLQRDALATNETKAHTIPPPILPANPSATLTILGLQYPWTMELEDEASLDIVCADSEDNILLNEDGDSFGCLSEEDVEIFQPPRGRMIETKEGSELVDSLRKIAKSSPQMADLLLQNSDVLDKRLNQIAQASSMTSSYVEDTRDEIVQKSSVTVVDYPSNDRVEVFGPIDNDEAERDTDESGEELLAPSLNVGNCECTRRK